MNSNFGKQDNFLSFITFTKKIRFRSEAQLYDSLQSSIKQISCISTVHLTTYPYVSVHIECGNPKELIANKIAFEKTIQKCFELNYK
jgi:hypothetical protein